MTENGRFQHPFHSEEQKRLQYTCDSSLGFKKKRSCQVKEPELEASSIPELRSFFSLQGQHDRVVLTAQKVKKMRVSTFVRHVWSLEVSTRFYMLNNTAAAN